MAARTERVTIRVSTEEREAIEKYCEAHDENINRVARKGIRLVIPKSFFHRKATTK